MSTFGAYPGAHPLRDAWSASERPAAEAIWSFHEALKRPTAPELDGDDLADYFRYQSELASKGEPLSVVPEPVWKSAYEHVNANRLHIVDLAMQVESAIVNHVNTLRFEDYAELYALIDRSAVCHCRLLAQLAGVRHRFLDSSLRSLGRAYFLLYHLVFLKNDAMRDRIFIPLEELDQAGVSTDDILRWNLGEALQKVLWRNVVRTRDAFAGGGDLVDSLEPRIGRALRTSIHTSLEVLNKIERVGFDVWSQPIALSRFYRAQAWYQARFGRVSFQ